MNNSLLKGFKKGRKFLNIHFSQRLGMFQIKI